MKHGRTSHRARNKKHMIYRKRRHRVMSELLRNSKGNSEKLLRNSATALGIMFMWCTAREEVSLQLKHIRVQEIRGFASAFAIHGVTRCRVRTRCDTGLSMTVRTFMKPLRAAPCVTNLYFPISRITTKVGGTGGLPENVHVEGGRRIWHYPRVHVCALVRRTIFNLYTSVEFALRSIVRRSEGRWRHGVHGCVSLTP